MFNSITLAGNLTRDIEIRYSQGGSAISNTAIATSRKYKTQAGEQKEEVLFVDLVFFGRSAEVANQYLRKGSKILVQGRLKLEQWQAQDGSKRSKHVVTVEVMQMLDSKPQDGQQQQGQQQGQQPQQQQQQQQPQQGHATGGGMNNPSPQQQQGYNQQQGTPAQHLPNQNQNTQGNGYQQPQQGQYDQGQPVYDENGQVIPV